MQKIIPILLLLFPFSALMAGRVSGTVTDEKGQILSYASILVKGTTLGTTANNNGKFFIELAPGNYTIVCQYVGYQRQEKEIQVGNTELRVDFRLSLLQLSLAAVEVRPGGEDPAYEIIRQAIKKRKEYEFPLDSFTCEAYIKTIIKTRRLPRRILGKKIDDEDWQEMGVDSAGKGIIHLSESITKIAYKKPDKTKLEILSGRESGSNGYGFNFPSFINFYSNNVSVLSSPFSGRGFVSPIADAAMNYYRYKYLGSFTEDGREINKILVIPRRKFEPLFAGTINITEGDWRIHSLELVLTKESQLEIIDTLRIKQIQVPVGSDIWRTKDQLIYFTFKQFGIDAIGNFLNVYSKYDIHPGFGRKYFNNIVIRYDTAVNKKSKAYWDSIRPIPLEPEEVKDYTIKDSAFEYRRDSVWSRRDRDSLFRARNRPTVGKFLWSGYHPFSRNPNFRYHTFFSWEPLLKQVQYNTVEGINVDLQFGFSKQFRKWQHGIVFAQHIRYGFENTHLNPWASLSIRKNNTPTTSASAYPGTWTFSGGKLVRQFNNDNPISPLMNSVYTLLFRKNYMKIYESRFASLGYTKPFDNGPVVALSLLYEDRLPLANKSDYSFFKSDTRSFTPNYPYDIMDSAFAKHQALVVTVHISFKPGQKYIQFPRNKIAIGSKYPTFSFSYSKGISGPFGSDVDFDKWMLSAWDDLNLKLRGRFKYRLGMGGFLNRRKVFIQDYQHFNGNQLIFASAYSNSFQMAPYYGNSTTASLYLVAFAEEHLNGMLTNKIPVFRRLNWNLVLASNAFYVNRDNNYVELSAGLENIFKLIRIDLVASYLNGSKGTTGIRVGLGGLLGGNNPAR